MWSYIEENDDYVCVCVCVHACMYVCMYMYVYKATDINIICCMLTENQTSEFKVVYSESILRGLKK
jgi:hypothetical protein